MPTVEHAGHKPWTLGRLPSGDAPDTVVIKGNKALYRGTIPVGSVELQGEVSMIGQHKPV